MAAILSPGSAQGDRSVVLPQKSSRRRACNECKQQKIRCDLTADHNGSNVCSRCRKIGLDCKVESSFQRTRKRRRSYDLENEIKELRQKLAAYEDVTSVGVRVPSNSISPHDLNTFPHDNGGLDFGTRLPSVTPVRQSDVLCGRIERSQAPGLTTKPVIDVDQTRSTPLVVIPQVRMLADIRLSVEEIEDLFTIYFTHFHQFLPFLKPDKSPHAYYESSELLFWSIISVASHRSPKHPTLLSRLARAVTDLIWGIIRSVSYSVQSVQSLAILCTWPFPTSSSTSDPTYTLAGTMMQLAFQMGLHCASGAQDFTKIPLNLNTGEYGEWVATWQACNIVAHSVSIGCGLPATVSLHDSPFHTSIPHQYPALVSYLRIEQFRHRVSLALAPHALSVQSLSHERTSLYRLLDTLYGDLVREITTVSASPMIRVYLSAASVHYHAFYLLDDTGLDGYTSRIATLYCTACAFVSQALEIDEHNGLFHYWPFFCYQIFVAASFMILKIIMNGSFDSFIDVQAGKSLLNSAILALRRMSVANNDLPARLSDVLGFLYSLPNGGDDLGTAANLRPRVRNRLSVSVVYDLLWQWRKHFQTDQDSSGPVSGDHMSLDFDQLGLAGAFNFEWPDIAFEIPLETST
ncbi:hypothetical protein BJY04DRAFT_228209 [Aspergillus karnatakaensis]|uniref:Zn(II)2Cys6 transcription factor n=1 Tax=Aspergillus karnatakaensis TaxID=1810916 RepID=UPI003CCE501C